MIACSMRHLYKNEDRSVVMTDHLLTRRQAVAQWLAATSLGIAVSEFGLSGPAQAQLLPGNAVVRS